MSSQAVQLFAAEDTQALPPLKITEEANVIRNEILAGSALILRVSNTAQNQIAVDSLAEIRNLLSIAEKYRVWLKAPVLKRGKEIDSLVQDWVQELRNEYGRLDNLTTAYVDLVREQAAMEEAERQAKIKQEEQRLKDEADAKERERQRIERENREKIEAANKAAQEIKNKAARVEAQRKAEELAKQEADRLAAEEAKRVEEAKARDEQIEQKKIELGPPIEAVTAEGQSVKPEWDYKITDIHKLYLDRGQQCVELSEKRAAIKNLINAGGVRKLGGVEIFAVTKQRISQNKSRRLIDV